MAENDKFETLGDAYAKYPQSTLVMRKQFVDEKDATIADLQKTNATIANNAVIMNRKINIIEEGQIADWSKTDFEDWVESMKED